MTYKERLEMDKLAQELEELEGLKYEIEKKLSSGNIDGLEINELSVQLGDLIVKIDLVTSSWMELAEKES